MILLFYKYETVYFNKVLRMKQRMQIPKKNSKNRLLLVLLKNK